MPDDEDSQKLKNFREEFEKRIERFKNNIRINKSLADDSEELCEDLDDIILFEQDEREGQLMELREEREALEKIKADLRDELPGILREILLQPDARLRHLIQTLIDECEWRDNEGRPMSGEAIQRRMVALSFR